MTRLLIHETLLLNLQEKLPADMPEYMTRDEAYDLLKRSTGQDFGYDAAAWGDWFREHKLDVKRL